MKKFLSILLLFSLLLSMSLLACENKTDDPKDDDEEKKQTTELSAEDKKIMDDLIFLMEDDTYDTNELIGKFFCDFTIDRFDGANLPYSRIYKVGDVLAVENKNNETTYQIVKDGKLCTVYRTNDGAKLHLESEQEYPYDYPLSIFTAFGVDMSSVYSPEGGADNEAEEPKATIDSLTVAKDKKSVVFSDEYLEDVAKYLCTAFEPSDDEMKKFIDEMTASGIYTLDDQTAKFSIEGTIESVGDIKIETSFSFEGTKPSSMLSSISVTMESDGVPVTVTQEQNIRNMTYENDELVSLTVETRELTNAEYTQSGVVVKVFGATIGTYDFMLENSLPSSVSISVNAEQSTSYGTQNQESRSSLTFFVKDNNLSYDLSQNGLQQAYIAAEGVAFKAPENVTIPEDIYTVLPK